MDLEQQCFSDERLYLVYVYSVHIAFVAVSRIMHDLVWGNHLFSECYGKM